MPTARTSHGLVDEGPVVLGDGAHHCREEVVADRNGLPLKPGDPVLYQRPDRTEFDGLATVLTLTDEGRYLIQLDPIGPKVSGDFLGHEERIRPILAANPADTQDPFEVDGATLTLLGVSVDE